MKQDVEGTALQIDDDCGYDLKIHDMTWLPGTFKSS